MCLRDARPPDCSPCMSLHNDSERHEHITEIAYTETDRKNEPKVQLTSCHIKACSLQTKEEIAFDVKQELTKSMEDFGFMIIQTLVTDIEPDMKVRAAMNEINAAQRLRWATLGTHLAV